MTNTLSASRQDLANFTVALDQTHVKSVFPSVEIRHQSVLLDECMRWLNPSVGEIWVDCTCGGGGHSLALAKQAKTVIALDQDASMLALAEQRFQAESAGNIRAIQANFDQLPALLNDLNIGKVHGVLADLGFSSDQMDDGQRGLSFRMNGPLDMRLNPQSGQTAADLVNSMSESALADLIYEFGEERLSRKIARRIVERRGEKNFTTTHELADCIRRCVPKSGGIDPATRTFQALRIAVNDELGALERLLACLPDILEDGGRAGLISFHSLEDRRVKYAFKDSDDWKVLTKKPIEAGEQELAKNPRSRSAKLRVAVKQKKAAGSNE